MKFLISIILFLFNNVSLAEGLEQRVRQLFVTSNVPSIYKYGGYVMFRQEMDNNLCEIKKKFPSSLFMVDHEGGSVNRIKSNLPAANRVENMDEYVKLWNKDSKILKEKCFDVVLGPTVDSYLGNRSYSVDIKINLIIADKVANTIEQNKLVSVYKHFPGSFTGCINPYEKKEIQLCPQGLKEINEQWKSFKNNTASSLMISNHIYKEFSSLPAVIDERYYKYLRKDLNFKGVIITDALWEMSAPLTNNAVWEIFKNADILMIMNPLDAEKFLPFIIKKIKENPHMIQEIELKEKRIEKMKQILK